MVQEFQVLRCFSCQTFQVQQVKKSKKWSCKMCGEKQSLKKEYGRGTGADCRRHVQKLNSLRGELLEVENEKAQTQWEKETECEAEDNFSDEAQSCKQQVEVQATESRWSKYVDQTEKEPKSDEDEEKNFHTERPRFRSCDKMSRKRKKGAVCEKDPDSDPAHWKAKVPSFKLLPSGGSFRSSPDQECSPKVSPFGISKPSSPICSYPAASPVSKHAGMYRGASTYEGSCTEASKQPSDKFTTEHHLSVTVSDSLPPSSSFQRSCQTKNDSVISRWAQFLPSASAEDKDEIEDDSCAQVSSWAPDSKVGHSPSAPFMSVPPVTLKSSDHLQSKGVCSIAPLDVVFDLGNRSTTKVFEKLSQCMTGRTSNRPSMITSMPDHSCSPVCVQPPPVIKPCPALSFSTYFQTNEDFDDSF